MDDDRRLLPLATIADERDAYWRARIYHFRQRRKVTNEPYFLHLVRTSLIAQEFEPDAAYHSQLASISLLHDIVEDTNYSEMMLRSDFPRSVAESVLSLSQPQGMSQFQRRVAYVHQMQSASSFAVHVSLSDKIDNLRCSLKDFSSWGGDKFPLWQSNYLVYYYALQNVYHAAKINPKLLDEFDTCLEAFSLL